MHDSRFRLDDKVAVVTGAAQGIGRALAIGLAQAGAAIAITDLPNNASAAEKVREEIVQLGGSARTYDLDVLDLPAIQRVLDQIASEMGSLDILINNAGVRVRRPSLEVSEQEWDAIVDVNLKGVFFCAQAAAPHMMSRNNGRIINVASQLGVTALPERAAYCASKAGVINLTRVLALEWCDQGITVNAIGPGPTNTPMTSDVLTPEAQAELRMRSPIGRRLEPEEIVGAVVFLAGPNAAAVNGQVLLVDAGWTAQ